MMRSHALVAPCVLQLVGAREWQRMVERSDDGVRAMLALIEKAGARSHVLPPHLARLVKWVKWPDGARERFEARTRERRTEGSATTEQVLEWLEQMAEWGDDDE